MNCWKSGSARCPISAATDYSIADIATFPWTRNHDNFGVKWEDNPNLARWFNAIAGTSGGQEARSRRSARSRPSRDTATDDQKDRLFGRGKYARA